MPPRKPKPSTTVIRSVTLELDERTALLAAEALAGEADRRRRAGVRLSGELAAEKAAGADIRTKALSVVDVLGEADALEQAAEELASAWSHAELQGDMAVVGEPPAGTLVDPDAALAAEIAAGRAELGLVPDLEDDDAEDDAAGMFADGDTPLIPGTGE